MNIIAKTGVAGALALSATGAFALGIPSTNSSDLVLVVQNVNTPADVYMLDTGISLNTIFPSGSFVSGASLSTALAGINDSITASATLAAFLAANPASDDAWTLEGAQYGATFTGQSPGNANTKTAGNAKGVFTSLQPGTNVAGLGLAAFQLYLGQLQGEISGSGDMSALQTSTENDTTVSYSTTDATKGIFAGSYDLGSLGSTAIPIYALTGNNGTGTPQSYILGSATLSSAGTLTITGNPVPLPAAVWLFGSGVLGLIGVSRRRKAAVEAA
jgi:hypothetical protein